MANLERLVELYRTAPYGWDGVGWRLRPTLRCLRRRQIKGQSTAHQVTALQFSSRVESRGDGTAGASVHSTSGWRRTNHPPTGTWSDDWKSARRRAGICTPGTKAPYGRRPDEHNPVIAGRDSVCNTTSRCSLDSYLYSSRDTQHGGN